MSIKSPNSDDVFGKFIEKTPAKVLEKIFGVKGVKFEKSNISAAESVQNVLKSAIFFFRSETATKEVEGAYEEKIINSKNLNKIKFFDFQKSINQLEWKGKKTIPMFNSISSVNCEKCNGLGYLLCRECKGSGEISCDYCKGEGQTECKKCKGTGKNPIYLEVIIGSQNEKEKRSFDEKCTDCFGTGKIPCKTCGGSGKKVCSKCKGTFGKKICKDCLGKGVIYKYRIGPVPFEVAKSQYVPHLFFKPEFETKLGEELSLIITKVDGIYIKNLKDLDEKIITAKLGYWDGDIRSRMNDAKQIFSKLEKSNGPEKPQFPIYLFPILKLDIKSERGKSFSIFSIGTDRGFEVFAPNL